MPLPSIDWKKKVEESQGASLFVPEKLQEKVKEWHDKRLAFNKRVNDIAQQEIEISVMFQNLILEVRQYLAENGRDNVWTADVGFDTQALRDGIFVINITENTAK